MATPSSPRDPEPLPSTDPGDPGDPARSFSDLADVARDALGESIGGSPGGRVVGRSGASGAAPLPEAILPPTTAPLPPEVAAAARDPARVVGRYVLVRELGRGGMGVVHGAWDTILGRPVAIKSILETAISGRALARFEREARAVARLQHEAIIPVHEVGRHRRLPYIVMSYIDGESLEARLRRGLPPPREAARLIREVAAALAHAHERGVIHRDVKPENVIVDGAGRPHLMDFGLAREVDGQGERITVSGQMVGTPAYMSPEQLNQQEAGPATDIWALGGTLYRALVGRPPFEAESIVNLARQILVDAVVPPRRQRPAVPADLEAIVLRCLEKAPADRYPSAAALGRDLERFLAGDSIDPVTRGRRARSSAPMIVAGAVLLGVAAAVAVVLGMRGAGSMPAAVASGSRAPESAPESAASGSRLPAAPEGWHRQWTSRAGETRLVPDALWDEAGQTADPLRGLDGADQAALVAAFDGLVTVQPDGRVSVRYDPTGPAVRIEIETRAGLFTRRTDRAYRPLAGRPGPDREPSLRIEAPNDAPGVSLMPGRASWDDVRVGVRLHLEKLDGTELRIQLGGSELDLAFEGRSRRLAIGSAAESFDSIGAWHDVELQPTAPVGGRVRVDGVIRATLEAPAGELATRASRPRVSMREGIFEFARLDVSGRPRSADVAALAIVPASLGTSSRVAVRFAVESTRGAGGPLVGIGDPSGGGDAIVAEVDGAEVTLRHGARLLGVGSVAGLDAAGLAGTIVLERRDDLVVLRLAIDGGEALELERAAPLPLAAPRANAFYGSTGPRVRFDEVAVDDGPSDRARAAWDAAGATGTVPAIGEEPGEIGGLDAWRRGAVALDRAVGVAADSLPDPAGYGPNLLAALAHLERADDLPGSVGHDRLARLTLARILVGDGAGATATVRELIERVGLDEARQRIDVLEANGGRPCLVERLVEGGYGTGMLAFAPIVGHAAACVAAELAPPDARADPLYLQGQALRNIVTRSVKAERDGRGGPEVLSAEERASFLSRAEERFAEAHAAGRPIEDIDAERIAIFLLRGELARAIPLQLARLERQPEYWFNWLDLAQTLWQLGRRVDALEAEIGGLARAPGEGVMQQRLVQLLRSWEQLVPDRPGLAAIAMVVVADGLTNPSEAALRRQEAGAIAGAVDLAASSRDADLARYALVRLGLAPAGELDRRADRPTLDLLRARKARSDEVREILGRARSDRLVESLILLDPILRPLLVDETDEGD